MVYGLLWSIWDSDFAGDKETRVSIASFVIYLLGLPISWRSKGMRSVTLSSSHAEYVALSEAAILGGDVGLSTSAEYRNESKDSYHCEDRQCW